MLQIKQVSESLGISVVLCTCWLFLSVTANDFKTTGSLKREEVHQQGYANFVKHENSYLNVTAGLSTTVLNPANCGYQCALHLKGLSFNFRVHPTLQGLFVCEVLETDKYNDTTKFLVNQIGSTHYSISSPCKFVPCRNGARCKPAYETDEFTCVCLHGTRGNLCQIVDGQWSAWSSWGSCSVWCGGGRKSRSKTCTNPAPANGGSNCVGISQETTTCNTHACPVHGKWSGWSSWGSCTVNCGGGTRSRTRTCTNPAPAHGGNDCLIGRKYALKSCNTHECPVHGQWSGWSSRGSCTVTCGGGSQSRSRTCTRPAPAYGGNDCVGTKQKAQSCNTNACPPEWKEYSPYWCAGYRTPIGTPMTKKQCKDACTGSCTAIEWWGAGYDYCFRCTDTSKRTYFTNTADAGYPPYVLIKN